MIRVRGPSTGSLSPPQTRTTRPKRRKRLRSPSPSSPSTPRRNSYHYPHSSSPPPPPSPPSQYSSQSRFSISSLIFSIFSPGLPLVIMVTFASVAVIFLSNLLSPLTSSLGHVVDNLANINAVETIHALVAPAAAAIGSIPVKDIWCNGVGIGCVGPDRNAAFTTDSFTSLDMAHPANQISLGHDFFDCLSDLRISREQDKAVSQ